MGRMASVDGLSLRTAEALRGRRPDGSPSATLHPQKPPPPPEERGPELPNDEEGLTWEKEVAASLKASLKAASAKGQHLHVIDLMTEAGELAVDTTDEDVDIDAHLAGIVPETDDPTTPVSTFRMYFLGTIFGCAMCYMNSIFAFKSNSFSISPAVITIISYPLGRLMAHILPTRKWKILGCEFTLNPGPFNLKEHVVLNLTATAISGSGSIPYGIDNVVTQRWLWANTNVTIWNSLAFVICTQLAGFGMAGMMRRFLVWPKNMMWPRNLPVIALFVSFHRTEEEKEKDFDPSSRYRMSRFAFFWVAIACIFAYEWIPNYLIQAMQMISLLCFVSSNVNVRLMGAAKAGPGIATLTFDWQYILSGWMTMPFWAASCVLLSMVIWNWIIPPATFYANAFGGDQELEGRFTDLRTNYTFPAFNSVSLYDKDGKVFDSLKLVLPDTLNLNTTAYEMMKPIRITTYFAILYCQQFMNIAAVITHCFLWHGSTIVKETKAMLRGAGRGGDDIHNQLMRAYPEVSEYVYLGLLMVFTVIMCLVGTFTPFTLPVWAVLLAVAIAALFMLPTGIIIAITGQGIYLNVFTEFIIGLIIPGQTVAVMAFKSFGMNLQMQAMTLLSDLKLGHYLKIPPRQMLITQFYGTTVGAIISTVVCYNVIVDENWLKDLNNEDSAWNGINFRIFTNAGAIWGAIGPARFFGGLYSTLFYSFLIGPVLCLVPYFGNKMYPSRLWKYFNIPLLTMPLAGAGMPQNMIVMSFVTAFIFQYWLFRHRYNWYSKYNYVLAAALDTGTAIAVLVTSQVARYIVPPIWSGNPLAVTPDYYCYTPGRMCAGKAYCSKFNDP